MPTYDYECDACEHAWELFQKITDDPVKKCPECGKKKARRLFGTGAAIMFKGSGFYETDYRSESYKKSADKDKKAAEGSSDSKDDSKKSDSKKSESKADSTKKSESKPKSDGGSKKKKD
jgi:putative FmdB family regulatory protein